MTVARNIAIVDKTAKLPCGIFLHTRPQRLGRRGRVSPDARPCNVQRSGLRLLRVKAARSVSEHIAACRKGSRGVRGGRKGVMARRPRTQTWKERQGDVALRGQDPCTTALSATAPQPYSPNLVTGRDGGSAAARPSDGGAAAWW